MGINLARTNMSAALPLALLVVLVAASSLTLSATAHQQNECSPKIPDTRLSGQCLPLRQCAYFMRILSAPTVSQADRQLLRESQCNEDKNVHVCCPTFPVGNAVQPRREGLGALKHPLLPTECGAVKWELTNGTETQIKEYPWLALIEYIKPDGTKLHACGGVLISQRYVLTAAHCVSSSAISRSKWQIKTVRLGEWDTTTNPDCQVIEGKAECAPPFQDVPIEEIKVHPLYNKESSSQTNDIAMIRLGESVVFSDYVQPICLPNKQLRADELEGLVTEVGGWQAKSSTRMQKSQVLIASIERCQEQYAAQRVEIKASQLCGEANTDECHGNAGGPLMLLKNGEYLLGGLLSFGPVPCPSRGWPDIYTRVASYIEWIHENLAE